MPKEVFGRDWAFLPRPELLTFEEISRAAAAFVALGVEKVRITGGEPLLRRDLPRLIETLAAIPGLQDLTLTTNGTLLTRHAATLRSAGLKRLTVSLDALDDATFRAMNDVQVPVTRVLEGIAAAESAGYNPLKINVVIKRRVNESSILDIARHFRHTGHIVRFIEYMDVGSSNGWRMQDVVTAQEIYDIVAAQWPLHPVPRCSAGEVAKRFRYLDGAGEIGIIAAVTQPFCRNCTRARLTADGQLYTCLFANQGTDVRTMLRDPDVNEAMLQDRLRQVWSLRTDRYSESRHVLTPGPARIEMSRVGG